MESMAFVQGMRGKAAQQTAGRQAAAQLVCVASSVTAGQAFSQNQQAMARRKVRDGLLGGDVLMHAARRVLAAVVAGVAVIHGGKLEGAACD